MKRLKIILQSNFFYILTLLCLIVYVWLCTSVIKYHSFYPNGEIILQGRVSNIALKENKLTFIIKDKEKIKATYYLKEEEMIDLQEKDTISIQGIVSTPSNNTIFNTFNYKRYLYQNHIYKTLTVKRIDIIKKSRNPFTIVKNKIIKRASINQYLCLFITGNKSLLDSSVYESYQTTGVAHLLAISGMHISILVYILKKLLKYTPQIIENIIIFIFLIFYAYIVGFSASVMRVVICYILKTKQDYLKLSNIKILLLSLFILVVTNPFIIYNIGFQYSYLTAFSIIITQKYHHKNYLLNILIITSFASLFTLPITINLNYEINVLSIISNLIMVPFVSFIIFPFSLITFIMPIFLNVYTFITNIMEKIILMINQFHLLTIIIPRMNFFLIFLYYVFLLLFVYYGYKKFIILLLLPIVSNIVIYHFDSSYKIVFFDVSQGDSSIIICPYQKNTVLIDSGGITSYNGSFSYQVSDNIIKYLKSVGISKISDFVITHGDFDHMGEAINLVDNFKVEKVIFNCGEFNDLEKELIKVLDKKRIKYYTCIKELNIDNNKLYFLQTKEYDNENDNSNVIYTEINGYKFMFMGDAGIEKEKDILEKYNISNIDVLKIGHHGSKTSSGKEFINEINPKYSIISVGKNNKYGHPNKEVLDNLDESKIYRTDQDGSIMLKVKNNKLKIETCSP